jgi:hypothetical protein
VLVYNGAFRGKKLGVMTYYTPFPPSAYPGGAQASAVPAAASSFEAPVYDDSLNVPTSMRPASASAAEGRSFPVGAALVAALALVAAFVA